MCRHSAQAFPPDTESAAAARAFIRGELSAAFGAREQPTELAQDAAVVVTELVTNAVAAGSSTVRVDLTVHRTHLDIAVGDDAPGTPQLTPFDSLDEGHRGLHIVDALARTWSVQRTAEGKEIRAELTLPRGAIEQLDCTSPV